MSWRDYIFEDDAELKQEAAFPARPVPSVPLTTRPMAVPPGPPPPTSAPPSVVNQRYYSALLTKTDVTFAPNLAHVLSFAEPLVSIIPDRATRMRAAAAQAKADPSTIAGEINHLQELLKNEGAAFATELENKRRSILTKSKQVGELEAQLQTLKQSVTDDVQRADQAQQDFDGAYKMRENELKQLAAESSNWRL